MIRFVRQRRLFLMEAMWTRFFPLMTTVREMIVSDVIGEVKNVDGGFWLSVRGSEELGV